MLVDILEREVTRDHEDLGVIEQLRNLLGRGFTALELGCHPRFGCFFYELLADGMDPGVELLDGAGTLGAGNRLLGEFCEQGVESLHNAPV